MVYYSKNIYSSFTLKAIIRLLSLIITLSVKLE